MSLLSGDAFEDTDLFLFETVRVTYVMSVSVPPVETVTSVVEMMVDVSTTAWRMVTTSVATRETVILVALVTVTVLTARKHWPFEHVWPEAQQALPQHI